VRHVLNVAGVTIVALALLSVAAPRDGARADHFVDQVPGYDISWPQCPDERFPPGAVAFTIIGLNGGRPFTPNPCFLRQYRWAQRFERHPAVYINVDYPKEGRDEPARTGPYGTCVEGPDFEWCRAYNYGYALARDAVARVEGFGLAPPMWWLDVETGNHWSGEPTYNAQVVRAVIDYFKERGLPAGIYSTPRQWRIIAGPYAPGLPVWTAGASGIEDAKRRCDDPTYAFAGGQVQISQYYDHGLDTNFLCPQGHPLSGFPLPDPFGRDGPYARSISLEGETLPLWFPVAMLAMD